MRSRWLVPGIAFAVLAGSVRDADAAAATVRPAKAPARACVAVQVRPGAFNAAGNLLVGWSGDEHGEDGLVELTPAGATVWECRLRPGGTLAEFARSADGTTFVAQWSSGRFSRILVVDPAGQVRAACQLSIADAAAPPRPTGLYGLPGGGVMVSTAGWAACLSRRWRVEREMIHRSLRSAAPLADGRWLAAFRDPERFAVYDPVSRSLSPIALDALCQLWEAGRAEEVSADRWRFYGCFCVPQAAAPGQLIPRKTMEVVDTDPTGRFLWAWGSVRAIRVEEFGVQRCATYTRAVALLPAEHLLVLDGYPADCRVAELDAGGETVRVYLMGGAVEGAATGASDAGTFGEHACGLTGLKVLSGP